MIRFLLICNADFTLNKFMIPFLRSMKEAGYDVEAICDGLEVDPTLEKLGIKVHQFEFPRTYSPLKFLHKIFQMKKLIENGNYDIINNNNRNASIVGRVATFLARKPINTYTARGFYFHDDQGKLARFLTISLEAFLAKITDFTLAQSDEDRLFVIKKGIIPENKIKTIGNGIDTNRFVPLSINDRRQYEAEFQLSSSVYRVAALGRLVRGKGFMDLLHAFYLFKMHKKDAELLIIGGTISQDIEPFQEEIFNKIKELKLEDSVKVTGLTNKVEKYLGISDIFVIPSYREGMPRALIEAMSVGIPTLASNIRGCREMVIRGETGYIFEPKNPKDLYDKLRLVSDLSPHDQKIMGEKGRLRTVENFDQKIYIKKQVDIMKSLTQHLR